MALQIGLGLYLRSDHFHINFDATNALRDDVDPAKEGHTVTLELILFEAMLFVVQVILLNLLIAIMSDTYSRVRASNALEARHNRALIIQEYELMFVYLLRMWRRLTGQHDWPPVDSSCFPAWLHMCIPETDDTVVEDSDSPRARHGNSGDSEGTSRTTVGLERQVQELTKTVNQMRSERQVEQTELVSQVIELKALLRGEAFSAFGEHAGFPALDADAGGQTSFAPTENSDAADHQEEATPAPLELQHSDIDPEAPALEPRAQQCIQWSRCARWSTVLLRRCVRRAR